MRVGEAGLRQADGSRKSSAQGRKKQRKVHNNLTQSQENSLRGSFLKRLIQVFS